MIGFEGQTVVVTGAGNGLGRAYALEFARRGALVVVNDNGCAVDGNGASTSPADSVVAEIVAAGGRAIASYASVANPEGGEEIIATALAAAGRVDAVVNNAGILRNTRFEAMTRDQLMGVLDTHLMGAFHVSQPAYRVMSAQGYGRFVFTSSGAGLFGARNEANYASAKAGIVGLSSAIAIEGADRGIMSNVVAPMATTRMLEGMRPEDYQDAAKFAQRVPPSRAHPSAPVFAAAMAVYLASVDCAVTRQIFSAAAGRFASVFTGVTRGWHGPSDRPATPEDIQNHLKDISDRTSYFEPQSVYEEVAIARSGVVVDP